MLASQKLFFQRVLTFHLSNFCTGMPSLLFMEDATIRWMMWMIFNMKRSCEQVLYRTTFSMTVTDSSPENTSLQLASGDGIFDLCYSVSAVHYLASASLTKTAEQRIGQLTSSLQRVLGPNARPCTLQAYLILVPIGRY